MVLERMIGAGDSGKVLRDYIKREFDISSRLLRKIKANYLIRINGNIAFTNIILKEGDILRIDLNGLAAESESILPEAIPIDIIYEDEYMIAINKQPGRIIHPSAYESAGTISNGLAYYFKQTGCLSRIHPISRLDRDTSGIILFAKDCYTSDRLGEALRSGGFKKEYLGIVIGTPDPPTGIIELPLGRVDGFIMLRAARCDGKHARTYYETLRSAGNLSLLLLNPVTGRTHQLRAHLSSLGYPLLSDGLYNRATYGSPYGPYILERPKINKFENGCDLISTLYEHKITEYDFKAIKSEQGSKMQKKETSDLQECNHSHALIARQALHSWRLTLKHPHTGRPMMLTAPLPADFTALLNLVYGGYYP